MTFFKDLRKMVCCGLGAVFKTYKSAYDVGYKCAVIEMEKALRGLKP